MINKVIKWIMLVSGVLTCATIYAAFAPQAALMSFFGAQTTSPLAELIVRNWAVLVTLMGILLIYGAFRPAQRKLILIIVGISKISYIGLVLAIGSQYLGKAGITIAFDAVIVVVFIVYLISAKSETLARSET